MRTRFAIALAALILAGFSGAALSQETVTVSIETNFSPHPSPVRPIQDAWLRVIDNAVASIRVSMYSFTLFPLRDALIQAKLRGVDVRAVAEDTGLGSVSQPNCLAVALWTNNIPIKEYIPNDSRNLLHHKLLVIDDSTLITGSANFTTSAVQFNHENSLIIKSEGKMPMFLASYIAQFESMWNDEFGFNGQFVDWLPDASLCPAAPGPEESKRPQ